VYINIADRSGFTVSSPIPSTHLGIWACGSTWRCHTGKHGSSAPHQRISQPTSWPHVASPILSSTEQVARPATKRFHTSDWRHLDTCCRPWTWWCNDATALAGYANLMMMYLNRNASNFKHTNYHLFAVNSTIFNKLPVYDLLSGIRKFYKILSYRRGTARCVLLVEILPTAMQQYRNYLYDKSWTNGSYEVGGLRWADV